MTFTLAYDSDCGPCTRFRSAVGFFDAGKRMRYLSLDDADRMGLLEEVRPTLRFASFHLISPSGRAWSGAAALPVVASLLPAGSLPGLVMQRNPLVSRGAEFVYSVLSRLHGIGACKADAARASLADAESAERATHAHQQARYRH